MRSLFQDVLLSLRSLRKEPASAFITSITLALGIGLCTISFSLVYGVFLRGLDVPEPKRLFLIFETNPEQGREWIWVNVHDFHDFREQQTSFEALTLAGSTTGNAGSVALVRRRADGKASGGPVTEAGEGVTEIRADLTGLPAGVLTTNPVLRDGDTIAVPPVAH